MKSTRRDLALALLTPALAAAPPQNPPSPAKEDLLEAARAQLRTNSQQLAAFSLDIALEPAFQFKP